MELREFNSAVAQIAEEKGLPQETVMKMVEEALAAAYKKEYGRKGQHIFASLDSKTLAASFFLEKEVINRQDIRKKDEDFLENYQFELEQEVDSRKKPKLVKKKDQKQSKDSEQEPEDEEPEEEPEQGQSAEDLSGLRFRPNRYILLEDAKKFSPKAEPGDLLYFPLKNQEDYGRIAAQTAKQVILQKIQEAERELLFQEFKEQEKSIVSGIVQRTERGTVYLDIGRISAVLPPAEQIPGESYNLGERIKAYVTRVEQARRGPAVFLSRTHPQMLAQMMELEVPEIASGLVEIKAIAREAGSRSKIAVSSKEADIDPIGACVGQKGSRIATVINEFNNEKIDVVLWQKEPADFIAKALSPAKVLNVEVDPEKQEATAVIPTDQLSLAIGKKGQNVRLAAKLTGWKINAVSPEGEVSQPEASAAPEG